MTKNKKKTMVVALLLVLAVATAGVIAYLTDKTSELKNTFTVGEVSIDLFEHEYDAETGALTEPKKDASTADATQDYKVMPGSTYAKDPTVTVDAASEDCWLFVWVQQGSDFDEFFTATIDSAWTKLDGSGEPGKNLAGVYYIEAKASDKYSVLADDEFTANGNVKADRWAALSSANTDLTFYAYAVQKENFDTAAEAWEEVSVQAYQH